MYIDVAKNVPNVETFGKSDPYVSLELQGKSEADTELLFVLINFVHRSFFNYIL